MSLSRLQRSEVILIASFFLFAFVSKLSIVHALDHQIMIAVQSVDSPILRHALTPFIVVGSIEFSIGILYLLSLWFYQKGEPKKSYLILAALILLTAIEFIMKQAVHHPRVPIEFRGRFPYLISQTVDIETNYSFPSGHSLRTALLFGVMYLWTPFSKLGKVGLAAILLYLCFQLISMNFYGFHWTSDVIGGYWLSFVTLYFLNQLVKT